MAKFAGLFGKPSVGAAAGAGKGAGVGSWASSPQTALNYKAGALGMGLLGSLFGGNSVGMEAIENPYGAALDMQQQAYNKEADLQEEQGRIALEEALAENDIKADQGHHFREDQAQKVNDSGVSQYGAPAEVLNRTVRLIGQELDAGARMGLAKNTLALRQAAGTRLTGRANLLSSQADFRNRQAQLKLEKAGMSSPFITALNQIGDLFQGTTPSGLKNSNPFKPSTNPNTPKTPKQPGGPPPGWMEPPQNWPT